MDKLQELNAKRERVLNGFERPSHPLVSAEPYRIPNIPGMDNTTPKIDLKAYRYNEGKLQWSLLDYKSLEGLVRVLEYGMNKYSTYADKAGNVFKHSEVANLPNFKDDFRLLESGRDNWKKGLDLKSILDSAQRHMIALMSDEFVDSESKLLHAHHVMCNMMFWVHFYNKQTISTKSNENNL